MTAALPAPESALDPDRPRGAALVTALSELAARLQRVREVPRLLDVAGQGLRALSLYLNVCRVHGDELEILYVVEQPPLVPELERRFGRAVIGFRGPLKTLPPVREALEERRHLFIVDLPGALRDFISTADPEFARRFHEALEGSGFRSAVLCPLLVHDRPWGTLSVCGADLGEDEVPALSLFSRQLAAAIEVAETIEALERRNHQLAMMQSENAGLHAEAARLFEAERRRAQDLSAINELAVQIAERLELAAVLTSGARHLARLCEVPNVFLFLIDASGEVLHLGASSVERPVHALRIPLSEQSAATHAVHTQAPVVVNDMATDLRISRAIAEHFGHTAVLAVPLISVGRPIGVVVLGETREGRRFSAPDVERAMGVGNQLATAISNARLLDDLKRSYQELSQAQQALVKRERLAAAGELAALVAHEVRNPLAVIFNSFSSLRRLLSPTGEVRVLLDIAHEEAERLNSLVTDFLEFARPNEPQLHLEALPPVLEAAVEAATSAQAHAHGPTAPRAKVEVRVEPGLPAVSFDPRLLRQALINLVVNALQSVPRGGAVSVSAAVEEDGERRWARVDVTDTGAGIAPAIRDQLFQPFFTTKASGTGLGLAVVKRIVDGHAGQISFESGPGGTTFTLRLPLQSAAAPVVA